MNIYKWERARTLNVSYQLFNIVRLNNITLLGDPVLQCEILILRAYQIEEAVAQG